MTGVAQRNIATNPPSSNSNVLARYASELSSLSHACLAAAYRTTAVEGVGLSRSLHAATAKACLPACPSASCRSPRTSMRAGCVRGRPRESEGRARARVRPRPYDSMSSAGAGPVPCHACGRSPWTCCNRVRTRLFLRINLVGAASLVEVGMRGSTMRPIL